MSHPRGSPQLSASIGVHRRPKYLQSQQLIITVSPFSLNWFRRFSSVPAPGFPPLSRYSQTGYMLISNPISAALPTPPIGGSFREKVKYRGRKPKTPLESTKHPNNEPTQRPIEATKQAIKPTLRPIKPTAKPPFQAPVSRPGFPSLAANPAASKPPVCYNDSSWPHEQHLAQSGIITTIAPQLRAGCWPDLISDSNERTPAAILAGFFLAHALPRRTPVRRRQ